MPRAVTCPRTSTRSTPAPRGAVVPFTPPASPTPPRRPASGRVARPAPSGRKVRLVTAIVADGPGLATDYQVRVAPGAVARIKLTRVARGHAWIDWVYVPPGYRDLGLGGQLLRRVLADADRAGARLSLEARACGESGRVDQAALERWYEGHGFVPTGRRGPLGPIFARAPRAERDAA